MAQDTSEWVQKEAQFTKFMMENHVKTRSMCTERVAQANSHPLEAVAYPILS